MAIFTGKDVQADRTLSCDVCVVGSGAGGAVVAQRLAAAGKRVIVLEDGGFHTSDTFDLVEKHTYPRLYQDAGSRMTSDAAINILQGRAVGGTTVVNWTTCFRTPPWVLQHWAEHHGQESLAESVLAPHFGRIEERLHVTRMQLSQVNKNNRVLWDGCKKLGYHVELLQRNVNRCAHTGYCGMGCPIDAKQSMLTTFVPDAVKLGVDIYANAHVDRVEGDGRKITRAVARIRDPLTDQFSNVTLTVEADRFVLACGGINTPALLLRSGFNKNGRVGKRTYLHPTAIVGGLHSELIEGFRGSPQYVACHEFEHRSDGRMGYMLEAAPVFPMSFASTGFVTGKALHARMTDMPFISGSIALLHDGFDVQSSDEGATITLTGDGRPKIDYAWNPRLEEALRDSAKCLARVQFAAGAERVFLSHSRQVEIQSPDEIGLFDRLPFGPGQVGVYSAHVMGGCAMGKDPQTSVVEASSLRHHELDNLFVVDGSVLPTAATVNPQMTIYGIASWASEQLVQLS